VTDLAGGCGVDEHAFNAEVGRKIRFARGRAELTQGALARLAGLTRGSITNIESGVQTPPLYRLARIAAALRVEPSDLLPRLEEGARVNELPDHLAEAVASVALAAQQMRSDHGQS
jgi:transcriptional regulator with XRE-family HTH domain